jgi:hypothetical protein
MRLPGAAARAHQRYIARTARHIEQGTCPWQLRPSHNLTALQALILTQRNDALMVSYCAAIRENNPSHSGFLLLFCDHRALWGVEGCFYRAVVYWDTSFHLLGKCVKDFRQVSPARGTWPSL